MNFKCWLENNDVQTWLSGSTITYPVYHGTSKKFDQFNYQKSQRFVLFSAFDVESKGFFFAENPHDALEFGPNVAACYIKITNPLLDPRRDRHLGIDRLPYEKELAIMKILAPMIKREGPLAHRKPYPGEKTIEGEPYIDLGVGRHYLKNRRYEFAHQWIYEAITNEGLNWDCLDNPQVIDRMKKMGFDGTFVAEPESHIGRSIFVPNADQVRIIKWVNGPQDDWGEKDDYYTKKVNGQNFFYGPRL